MTDSLLPLPLDHIGVAVKDIEQATVRYQQMAGLGILHDEVVESQKVKVRFLDGDHYKIELLEAIDSSSPVARFIKKRGEGIHHIAFSVDDIHEEMKRLRKKYLILQEKPIRGANNKLIFFIHPKSMGGTLVEICQPL